MANITETSTFEPVIHEIGTGEPVLGGPGGNSNVQAQQLANRTKWLKDAIDALESGGGPFEYNASAGTLPVGGTDGPGVAGIKRKDAYFVTVPGTVSSVALQVGDVLIAKQDDADVIGEFIIQQGNSELATPSVIGMVKLVQNISGGPAADAVLSVTGLINLFAQLASPALTGNPTTPDQTAGNNSTRIANTKYVDAAVGVEAGARATAVSNEATARINGDNAEANARAAADSGLQTNINNEANTRASADSTLQTNINNEANTRASVDSTLQTNINNEATNRFNGDNAVAALIPTLQWRSDAAGGGLTFQVGASDVMITDAMLPGCKVGFWCSIEMDAPSTNVGNLVYRVPGKSGYNVMMQTDPGYSTNVNRSNFSWFCPKPAGFDGQFSMGHFIGSGATADIRILAYI